MENNSLVETKKLSAMNIKDASLILADGMLFNPINVAAARLSDERRKAAFEPVFASVLAGLLKNGEVLGLFLDGRLIAVAGNNSPGCCQASGLQKLRFLPILIRSFGFKGTKNVIQWFDSWGKHDPKEHHWHFGPFAVLTEFQGKGYGSMIMREICQQMDSRKEAIYLETDKEINVSFYRKFGFEVISEADVLGVKNWFMIRRPQNSA